MNPYVTDVNGDKWLCKGNTLLFRGTSGINDCLMGLNTAYFLSHMLQKQIHLHFYWWHDEDYLFHCEDPETIIERTNYLESFYLNYGSVKVSHFSNVDVDFFNKDLHINIERGDRLGTQTALSGVNSWFMNDKVSYETKVNPNLIVLWRPIRAIGTVREEKLSYDNEYWNGVIWMLKHNGFEVQEIDYRTPIREVMYLIPRCAAVIGYQGLYQYISRNLYKPSIIVADHVLIRNHNPHAVIFKAPKHDTKDRNFMDYIRVLRKKLPDMTGKAIFTRRRLKGVVYGKK